MEDIKKYWFDFKEKLDEDPQMKMLATVGGVILLALVLFAVAKVIHSNSPSQATQSQPAVQSQYNTSLPAASPATQAPAAAQPAAAQPAPVATTAPQEVVSAAVKPLSELSKMAPGYMMSWSYAGGSNVTNLPELAKIEDLVVNQSTFQFSSKPESGLSNQIVPGNVILESKATAYFSIENQQSPIMNFLITSIATRRVQVFVDDQVTPVIDRVSNAYAGNDKESFPVSQPLAVGLHKLTIYVWTNYMSKDTQAVVRVSIKRDTDASPVDLQTYWPLPQAPAPTTQPAAVAAPAATTPDAASPVQPTTAQIGAKK